MVSLKEVLSLVTFQRVTFEAKVVSVDEVEEVSGGKKKQDVLIARWFYWDYKADAVGRGDWKDERRASYKLCGMVVREFGGKVPVDIQAELCDWIDDIGDVEEEDTDEGNSTLKQSQAIQVYIHSL